MVVKNIFYNYIGRIVSTVLPLVAIPIYIKGLGLELWGLISFISVLQGLLGIIDGGINQALTREISHSRSNTEKHKDLIILKYYEKYYFLFSTTVFLVLVATHSIIINQWINIGSLPSKYGIYAVLGAGAIFFFSFPGSVYRSYLVGKEEQYQLNVAIIIGQSIRHGGGMIAIYFTQSFILYILFQAIGAFFETFLRGYFCWHGKLSLRKHLSNDSNTIKKMNHFIIYTSVAVALGALIPNIDKIFIIKMLPIKDLGIYNIASIISLRILVLFYPITTAVFPAGTKYIGDRTEYKKFNLKYFGSLFAMVILMIFFVIFLLDDILKLWLNIDEITGKVLVITKILLIGTAFNALSQVGYSFWLNTKRTNRILIVNIISILIAIIVLPFTITKFGIIGATASWVLSNLIVMIASFEWIIKLQKRKNKNQTSLLKKHQ